ncbi:MAG: DUF4384 domain-containing protein [Deltaproteobacteria bacterium]|nr:DUF4384 domain-containing protein [Deltaproteobacteria bacterium]
MMVRNLIFASCTVLSTVLVGVGIWRVVQAPQQPRPATRAPALHLRLALLVEREQADGAPRALSRDVALRMGDRVQLTLQPEQAGHLLVGTVSPQGELSLLYPAPEQTGEVRGAWAYALPAPHQRYTFDGQPLRLVVLLRREPLPTGVAERRGLLQHALRRGSSQQSAHGSVVLTLEDGHPTEVDVERYSGPSKVLAVVALAAKTAKRGMR